MYAEWKEVRPSDPICLSELKLGKNFTDEGARRFLHVYDDTISFASASLLANTPAMSSTERPPVGDGESTDKISSSPAPPPPVMVKVGDYVQWTSCGQDQFAVPRQVTWISNDGSHLRAHGSMTGIPMAEVSIAEPTKPLPVGVAPQRSANAYTAECGELNVLLAGKRIQITADVDLAGLEQLKGVLSHYESILKLLSSN